MRAGVRVLYNALVEITAYRFNTFIKPVLSLVEDLDLPDMTIEQRMKPVIRYEGLAGVMLIWVVGSHVFCNLIVVWVI